MSCPGVAGTGISVVGNFGESFRWDFWKDNFRLYSPGFHSLFPEALAKGCTFQLSLKNTVRSYHITSPKLSFLMTIHLSIFLKLYKYLFNLLFFLHLWIQHAFPSAKPILCVSVFYMTAASTFPYPQSPFSLFLSFLCDHCLPFSLSGKACFSVS